MSENNSQLIFLDDIQSYPLIGQGNTAEIFEYSDGVILKLFHEALPYGAIEREWRCASVIGQCFKDTPKARGFVRHKDRYGILYEKVSGTDMICVALRHSFRLRKYGRILADIHVNMHSICIDIKPTLREKLTQDILCGEGLTDEEKQAVILMVERMPEKNSLCHFDFHPGNIMISDGRYMVIDWMTACSGDPAADAARTVVLMKFGEPMHTTPAASAMIRLCMRTMLGSYLRRYIKKSGITGGDISRWILPVCAARLSEWLTDHERARLIEYIRSSLQ